MSSGRLEYVQKLGAGGLELQERLHERQEASGYLRLEQDLEIDEFDLVQPAQDRTRRRVWYWTKILILAAVVFVIIGVVIIFVGPLLLEDVVIPILEWEAETFSRPVLAFVLVASLALCPVVLVPSGPSMWLAGIEFGYGFGFLIIMAGTLIGQSLPFFIGHQLLHNRIRNWLKRWPKQVAVLKVAEQGSWFHQFRAITLLRVSPFPYPAFNYAVTITNIGYGPYIMGSMVGMVPEAFIAIYSGKLLRTLADATHQKKTLTPVEIVYNVFGFTVAAIVGVSVTFYGRKAMQEFEMREAAEKLDLEGEPGSTQGHVSEDVEVKHDLKRSMAFKVEMSGEGLDRSVSLKGPRNTQPLIGPTGHSNGFSGELEVEIAIATAAA